MLTALNSVPGVQEDGVELDFDNKQATVTVDETFSDNSLLVTALEDAGFGGSIVE